MMPSASSPTMPDEQHQPQGLSGTRTEREKTLPGLISMKLCKPNCPFFYVTYRFSALPFRQYTNIFPWRSTQTAFGLLPLSNTVQIMRQCPNHQNAKSKGGIGINIGYFTLRMSSALKSNFWISCKKIQSRNIHFRMIADCSNLSG